LEAIGGHAALGEQSVGKLFDLLLTRQLSVAIVQPSVNDISC